MSSAAIRPQQQGLLNNPITALQPFLTNVETRLLSLDFRHQTGIVR